MSRELNELVMLERVEMIARLTADGVCQEKDREIALNLIAEIARGNLLTNNCFSVVFAKQPLKQRLKKEGEVRIIITLNKDQLAAQQIVSAFEDELTRRVKNVFPFSRVIVKKGAVTGVELIGFEKDSDRELLDSILQEVWEDGSWR